MFLGKILSFFLFFLFADFISTDWAWGWGPAVHTVIGCSILGDLSAILPAFAQILKRYPLEYLYGSLAADFFMGKGRKHTDDHPHQWECGFRFLGDAKDDREVAYACGFLSHLAADVVAHNYFVPNLICQASTWKRMGHFYWETRADHAMGSGYTKIAREILHMDDLRCDDLLKAAVNNKNKGIKTMRRLITQSVKFSDYLQGSSSFDLFSKGLRYQISPDYLSFSTTLSFRLVRDVLLRPFSSPCLSCDPVGAINLTIASRHLFRSKLFKAERPKSRFQVDERLLQI
jgi:hypothetical protein